MMFKDFLMKKMLEKQLAHLSTDERDKITAILSENPELFTKIGKSIQEKMSGGMDQMKAAMAVAEEFKDELTKFKR